jgi:hypothetical protein
MTTIGRCAFRWQARNLCKALSGMVAYELADHDGREVRLPFNPRVEYVEANEPHPWTVAF